MYKSTVCSIQNFLDYFLIWIFFDAKHSKHKLGASFKIELKKRISDWILMVKSCIISQSIISQIRKFPEPLGKTDSGAQNKNQDFYEMLP